MNPYKLKNVFEYLTSNNQLLKKKLKLGTSEIPIPPKRNDVTTIEAINRFNKANPRVDATNLKPISVKQSNVGQADKAVVQDAVSKPILTLDPEKDSFKKISNVLGAYKKYRRGEKNPKLNFNKFFELYSTENFAEGGRAGYEDGGMLVQPSDDGSRPGYGGPGSGSKPGVSKPVGPGTSNPNYVSPMKNPETVAKLTKTNRLKYQKTPVGERLQWIANNGKNYNNPENFIKAYEKHFNHKIGSKKDVLFNTSGKKALTQVDNLMNTGRAAQDLFTLKKGYNEEELFKASMIQNNPEIKKEFKTLFKDIHKDVSFYSELGPEGIVERLNKGKLLKEFDFIKYGVGSGITRNSLLNTSGVPTEHLTSYQNVRKPLQSLSQIIENLKNPSFAKQFKISPTTATKVRGQLDSFFKGEKGLQTDIRKINTQLGDVKFNNIFGGVNFEHTLAKQFGKDYKYLPRNYLLKGQFTTKNFNMIKKDVFDLPLIKLMKQYEQGKISGAKVQEFIDNFNAKTNNYADFKFDVDKGKLGYIDTKVSYDLSRYDNPSVARQELIDNIKLTQSDVFQKGMSETLPESKDQLKLFKSKEAKTVMKKLMAFCPAGTVKVTKAGGGRVPYADGPVCTPQEAARGLNEEIDKVKKGKATAGQTSRTLNKLKTIGSIGMGGLLKAGLVSEVLYEAAIGFDKVISEGQSPIQAFRQSYLTAPLRAVGALKSFEEGEREELLNIASDKGKVGRVLDLQDTVLNRDKLINKINNLETSLEDQQALYDGDFGYMGGSTEPLEKNITELKAQLQDSYRDGQVNRADELFSTKPQDLKIKDQSLMDAYNNAIEKRAVKQASNSLKAQSIAADDNRLRKANKAMIDLGGTYQDYKNPFNKDEYENFARQEGYLPSDKAYTDKYFTDEILNPMKFEQLMETPGFKGASDKFASGGLANLMKKYND